VRACCFCRQTAAMFGTQLMQQDEDFAISVTGAQSAVA
jgi:hypothetical protein